MLSKLPSLHRIVVGAVHRGAANSHLAHELALAIQNCSYVTGFCDFFHCAGSIRGLIGLTSNCQNDPASPYAGNAESASHRKLATGRRLDHRLRVATRC